MENRINQQEANRTLLWASARGFADIVRLMLQQGADVDFVNEEGDTALLAAVEHNHITVVEFLLENHATMNVTESHIESPEMANLLLRRGLRVNVRNIARISDTRGWMSDQDPWSARRDLIQNAYNHPESFPVTDLPVLLELAIRYELDDIALELLDRKVKVDSNLFNSAVDHNAIQVVKYMLDQEISQEDLDRGLSTAVFNHNYEMVRLLIRYGARLSQQPPKMMMAETTPEIRDMLIRNDLMWFIHNPSEYSYQVLDHVYKIAEVLRAHNSSDIQNEIFRHSGYNPDAVDYVFTNLNTIIPALVNRIKNPPPRVTPRPPLRRRSRSRSPRTRRRSPVASPPASP